MHSYPKPTPNLSYSARAHRAGLPGVLVLIGRGSLAWDAVPAADMRVRETIRATARHGGMSPHTRRVSSVRARASACVCV
eukprot:525792-Prorocentrum_minimum.AAC.2